MQLLKIFWPSATDHATELFTDEALKAVDALLTERNGKYYLRCQVRKTDIVAKPEEIVRQFWIYRLTHHYGYPLARIRVEFPITFGRDTSKRADIVVLDRDRANEIYILIEVKKAKEREGKEQLKSYAHATGAPLAVWSNGESPKIVWHRQNPNHFVVIPELPAETETIETVVAKPWTIETLLEFERVREVEGKGVRSLKHLIHSMEDEVLANAGVDVFEEVFKLIFSKLYDELSVYRRRSTHLRFRNVNTATELRQSIDKLFRDARQEWQGVFADDDRIRLTPDHLQVCVGSLEQYKLFNSNLDIIDDAFEYLINQTSKGDKGQYFTPRWVIDMCVRMMNPVEGESVIDTAAGSAGFTVHTIFKVWHDILRETGHPASHLFTMEEKPGRCYDYVRDKVFAIDFDEKTVRVARCLNLIAGDGETNVLHLNTLDYRKWKEAMNEEHWRDVYQKGWSKLKKLLARSDDFREFHFDVLMANPPFAGDIKQSEILANYELAHKLNGKSETAVGRDLLFLERNLDFLKPGGRMAVVLPQGRFNNASDKRVREFLLERCRLLAVVGLDGNSFKPHTGTKTSVLFVQKWNADPKAGPLCPRTEDYPIFFATQQLPGKDSRGEKIIARDASGNLLRDTHGHWVVQHDLFNHEGLTQDGIAEAFELFARKEKLSFFQQAPSTKSAINAY